MSAVGGVMGSDQVGKGSNGPVERPGNARRVPLTLLLAALVVCAVFFAVFGPTLAHLFRDWASSGEYGHGFLLLPIAGLLGWRSRAPASRPDRWWGAITLAGGVIVFLLGVLAAEFFTRRMAVLVCLAGLVLYYRGWPQLRAWWLPFGLMAFTIPLPEVILNSLTLPLQLLASEIAVTLLELRHVPVALAGNIILLPGQELFVAEACSGLRSLSALLGLTLLIGGTALRTPHTRAVLLLLAVPAAIAANALRVFGTGFGAYYLGPEVTHGALHTMAGALVFLLPLGLVGAATLPLRRIER